ncbi:MAG: glycosyltransferase [Rhodobacteraceae bacterium]|nr:glycosyltransferase [Paracoccaceae bacterium]
MHKFLTSIRGLVSRTPLNVIFHSAGIRNINLTQTNYKYIIVDHIEALGAINGIDTPYVLIAHNLEYTLSKDKIRNRFVHSVFQLSDRLKRYEHNGFANAKGVICISASEAVEISIFSDSVMQILPSFPDKEIIKVNCEKIRFGFMGPANWLPNARTVKMLISTVFPNVGRDFDFILAGAGWETHDFSHTKKIRLLGFVEDTREFWENVDILLAPTDQGAGVNVKICEALHYGVTVITNTRSADAIFGENPLPDNVLIADTNQELRELLDRIKLPEVKRDNGKYSQKYMGEKLVDFWKMVDN